MIFPSLFANVDAGTLSQLSIYLVLGFSFLINNAKKVIVATALGLALVSIGVFNKVSAYGGCGYNCQSQQGNQNYYGRPYGGRPVYPYPRMPFHTMYGPTNYYYRPFPPSPYRPVNCASCAMRYQQYSRPYSGWGSMPMTKIDIPLKNPNVSLN